MHAGLMTWILTRMEIFLAVSKSNADDMDFVSVHISHVTDMDASKQANENVVYADITINTMSSIDDVGVGISIHIIIIN